MRYANVLLILFLCAISFASESAPLRFAAAEMPKPDPCLPFITDTYKWVEKHWPDGATFRYYDVTSLEKAVQNREIDIVLTEAGAAARLRSEGARPFLTAVSKRHPNPASSQGSVIFVRSDNENVQKIADLQGRKLAATSLGDFTGYQAAMGEIFKRNYDPEKFFSAVTFVGSSSKLAMQHVVQEVIDGRADAGVVRTCFLEDLTTHKGVLLPLKVVEPYSDSKFACSRSTELYPNWTISSVPSLTAPELRRMFEILLQMPPTSSGMFWSLAPDFSATDRLMKDLRIGPYAFLRGWTLSRLWEEYRLYIFAGLLLVVGLLIHVRRTEILVERRTRELKDAFLREEALKAQTQEAEARLEQFQRAAIAGQVSNIFAHEIKQPLHSVSCFSHGLLRSLDSGSGSPDLMRRGLEKIESEVHEIGRIVDRVRSYAKGHAGERQWLNASAALEGILLRETRKHDVVARFYAPKGAVQIHADELELRLIFLNLIKNACEAAVAATAPIVSAAITTSGEDVIVEIADNGPKLSEDDLKHLNAPLSSTKKSGLGLGLPIVQGLVARCGGTIAFKRIPTGGLLCRVHLPVSPSEQQELQL